LEKNMAFPSLHDPAYGLSAEALEYARQRYEETEDSQRSIADNVTGPDAAPAPGSVAERLEAALERELRKVENLRADLGRPEKRTQQSDRIARTLATLTETLFRVRRLREPGNINGSNDDDLPADADGFRLALAHRIEVFVRSRTDASVPERDQPADGELAAS
jgi:hypothetical protein